MRCYKDFGKQPIGGSDTATLIVSGGAEWILTGTVDFGEGGEYNAHIVNGKDVAIGEHYKKVLECTDWLNIYDDNSRVFRATADHIAVWHDGERGCIIQTWDDD